MAGRIYIADRILEIGVGETLTVVDDWIGIGLQDFYVNDGHHPVDDPGPIFINRGSVIVTSASERAPVENWVRGIHHDSEISSYFMNASFVNAAGGRFSVSHTSLTGKATGFYSGQTSADFTNHGLFEVSSAHRAIGIENWNGNRLDRQDPVNFHFLNTGRLDVVGANEAFGALFYNGAYATNAGSITVTGGQRAWGVLMFGHAPELVNSGSITATQTGGVENSVGVYVSGGAFGSRLVNSGTITADVAIRENDFDTVRRPGNDLIENSGAIFGDIELSFAQDEIRNSGVIQGDVSFGDQDDLFLGATGRLLGELSMGGGDDRVESGLADDRVSGGDGRDQIHGGAGDDEINGDDGDDLLFGGEGDDVLRGGGGRDFLFGGEGNDVLEAVGGDGLDGGAGDDLYRLGEGRDVVVLGAYAGNDQVVGFEVSTDRFSISGAFLSATLEGGDTRLTHAGGSVLVRNVTGLSLSQWNALIDPAPSLGGEAGVYRVGGDADEEITGGAGDDLLYGGRGYDILRGGDGADRLIDREGAGALHGGAGNDVLIGGDGGFLMEGGDGDDLLQAGGGDDQLHGGLGDDIILGGAGDDHITGGSGANDLYGGDGDDLIAGGDGIDVIYGDAGRDVIRGGSGDDWLFDGGEDDLIYGEDGNDNITVYGRAQAFGGSGRDIMGAEGDFAVLHGEGDNDVLSGGWTIGTYLYGGDGDDRITTGLLGGYAFGGDGDDWLGASDYDAVLQGGAGNDDMYGIRSAMVTADYSDAAGYVTVDLRIQDWQDTHSSGSDRLSSIGNLTGSAYGDVLTGDGFRNVLSGGLGADRLNGDGGSDWLIGGEGGDTLNGGDGGDVLVGEAGDDHLDGGSGADTAVFAGPRSLYTITLAGGVTTVSGPEGTDRLTNVERLHFADGVYAPNGATPAGAVTGTAQADALTGSQGDDILFGGAGDDVITPGGGFDTVHGGDGIDTVVLPYHSGEYRITHFGGVTTIVSGWQTLTLSGVERLQFDTRTIILAPNGGDYITDTGTHDFLIGLSLNDLLVATQGNDRLEGRAGDDHLQGGNGEDALYGGTGDDILDGGSGGDLIDGGEGWDTLLLSGSRDDYSILQSGDGYIVKGLDGSDRVSGVEILRFADGGEFDLARQVLTGPGKAPGDDSFVLPPLADDQPQAPPETGADKAGDALVLPGDSDAAARMFAGLEVRLDVSGRWAVTLDPDGGLANPAGRIDDWLY